MYLPKECVCCMKYMDAVRLKSNAEMCGTDFDAKVEQLEVVDSD